MKRNARSEMRGAMPAAGATKISHEGSRALMYSLMSALSMAGRNVCAYRETVRYRDPRVGAAKAFIAFVVSPAPVAVTKAKGLE
jgi:hypothetical protein